MHYMVFRKDLAEVMESDDDMMSKVNQKYELKTFKPGWFNVTPRGISKSLALIIWWFLYLVIWRWQSKSYEYYLAYDEERLIHYCVVLPKYYRYPFMENNDIQIGPYWTAKEYRGQGICPFIVRKIMSKYKIHKKYAYVMMRANNVGSQGCVIRAGLNFYGYAIRTEGLFGKFLLETDAER